MPLRAFFSFWILLLLTWLHSFHKLHQECCLAGESASKEPSPPSPSQYIKAIRRKKKSHQKMWYMYTMKCYCPCLVGKLCPTLLKPHRQQPFSLPWLWDSLGKNAGVGCHFLLQEIKPDPGIKPASPALEGGFFTTEPTGKPPSFINQAFKAMLGVTYKSWTWNIFLQRSHTEEKDLNLSHRLRIQRFWLVARHLRVLLQND